MIRKPLLYFVPDVTDAKLFDRVRAFRASGFDVMTVGFSRRRYDTGQVIDWPHLKLGEVADRSYLPRVIGVGRLIAGITRIRQHLKGAAQGFFIARNLDMALMVCIVLPVLPRGCFVYECLDISPIMVKKSRIGRFARTLERATLRRVGTLWTSSQGFVLNYFIPLQGYKGPVALIENKIAQPAPRLSRVPPEGVWHIGWFGTLRCKRSLDEICAIAGAMRGRVVFHLYGYPARIGEAAFVDAIAPHDNITLHGPYAPDDLPEMLAGVHFSWGFDYADTWGNSQWLLPNRLYEAGYYHRPMLADSTHKSGAVIDTTATGWTFDGATLQADLISFLEGLSIDDWRACVARIAQRPDSAYAGTEDIAKALQALKIQP